jgi:hypothetical protein
MSQSDIARNHSQKRYRLIARNADEPVPLPATVSNALIELRQSESLTEERAIPEEG